MLTEIYDSNLMVEWARKILEKRHHGALIFNRYKKPEDNKDKYKPLINPTRNASILQSIPSMSVTVAAMETNPCLVHGYFVFVYVSGARRRRWNYL